MPPRLPLLLQERHLRQLAGWTSPAMLGRRRSKAAGWIAAASSFRAGSGMPWSAARSLPIMWLVETRAGGARSGRRLLTMKSSRFAGREELVAEGLDARRMPEVEPVDLEPVSPVAQVRRTAVARRRVAVESGW